MSSDFIAAVRKWVRAGKALRGVTTTIGSAGICIRAFEIGGTGVEVSRKWTSKSDPLSILKEVTSGIVWDGSSIRAEWYLAADKPKRRTKKKGRAV